MSARTDRWKTTWTIRARPFASSVAQLDESLAALDLELTADQRAKLDSAH